jgi:hypothetical protein
VGRRLGEAGLTAYPRLHLPAGPGTWALAAGLVVVGMAPFGLRRGIAG